MPVFLSTTQRKNMKAIVFSEQGSAEVLQYTDAPKPTLDTDEVLVKVEACAVNYLDIHARRNRPEIEEKLRREGTPHILGSDIAGTIPPKLVTQSAVLQSGIALFSHPAFRVVSVATAIAVPKTCVTHKNSSVSKQMADTRNT